jgi:type III pantothenate kinase
MLLAIDIGNTNIVFGIFANDKLLHKFRIETNLSKPSEEYAIDIVELFLNNKIDCLKINNSVIASVVPRLTEVIEKAVKKFYTGRVKIFGRDIKPNIEICLKNKSEVGQDRIINTIASYKKFGGNLIVVDFGTATTFDIVGEKGQYLGGVIAPGINLSIKILHDMTAQLPKIQLKAQKNVIGKSTVEAINSGIYFGYIGLIEGLLKRIKDEYKENYNQEMKVITTGGLSTLFNKAITGLDFNEPDLTLEGLKLVA